MKNEFSDEQVDDGLWYICCLSLSEISAVLWDESVPMIAGKEAVHSIRMLYTDCFAVRCAPILSHLDKVEIIERPLNEHPLNRSCYMWWDELTFDRRIGHPSPNEIDLECLAAWNSHWDLNRMRVGRAAFMDWATGPRFIQNLSKQQLTVL